MRRTSGPRVRRTKPVRSPSAAAAVTTADRSSGPGTVTVGGTASSAPAGAARRLDRDVPDACAAACIGECDLAGVLAPGGMRPKETDAGDASDERDVGARGIGEPAAAARRRRRLAVDGDRVSGSDQRGFEVGDRPRRVPLAQQRGGTGDLRGRHRRAGPRAPSGRPGSDERIATPGALTSGLSRSESGVGPEPLKSASSLSPLASGSVTAATVIARAEVPGEESEPSPNSSKSLPAATTGIDARLARRRRVRARRGRGRARPRARRSRG